MKRRFSPGRRSCAKFIGLDQRGFTLIEVLVAMVIMSIMIGLSMSRVSGNLPKWRAQGAADEMVTMIQKARAVSIKRNKWTLITMSGINAPPNSVAGLYVDLDASGTVTAGDERSAYMNFNQRFKGAYIKSAVNGTGGAVTSFIMQPDGTVRNTTAGPMPAPIIITIGSTADPKTFAVYIERSGVGRIK